MGLWFDSAAAVLLSFFGGSSHPLQAGNMTIRSKNPSSLRSQPSVQVVSAGQEKPTGSSVQSPQQSSARDVNEIHLGDSQSLEGMQPRSTVSQSGAEMLRETAQALHAKLQTQKAEAAGILREAMANQATPETTGRLVALQSEMAVTQKNNGNQTWSKMVKRGIDQRVFGTRRTTVC